MRNESWWLTVSTPSVWRLSSFGRRIPTERSNSLKEMGADPWERKFQWVASREKIEILRLCALSEGRLPITSVVSPSEGKNVVKVCASSEI